MDFEIKYDGKTIKFNLHQELQINEDTINSDLEHQPQIYAFLTMLHTYFTKAAKEAEKDKDAAYGKAVERLLTSHSSKYYKERFSYPPANLAKELAKKDVFYVKKVQKHINIIDMRDRLKRAVESFEQRASLMQTISANTRKERH